MVAATTVALLIAAGLVALTAPVLYLAYLGHVDESHAPRVGHTDPESAD